jgi:hypothetical protein
MEGQFFYIEEEQRGTEFITLKSVVIVDNGSRSDS